MPRRPTRPPPLLAEFDDEEREAVLSANRKQLIAYNSKDVLKQVDEIVERFVQATEDTLRIQVQFIAAVVARWSLPKGLNMAPIRAPFPMRWLKSGWSVDSVPEYTRT